MDHAAGFRNRLDALVTFAALARVVEQHLKKPLADAILFGALKDGGTAKVERKGDGLGIVTKAK